MDILNIITDFLHNLNCVIASFYIINLNLIGPLTLFYSLYSLSFYPLIKSLFLFVSAHDILILNDNQFYYCQEIIILIVSLITFYFWFAIFDSEQYNIISILMIIKYFLISQLKFIKLN